MKGEPGGREEVGDEDQFWALLLVEGPDSVGCGVNTGLDLSRGLGPLICRCPQVHFVLAGLISAAALGCKTARDARGQRAGLEPCPAHWHARAAASVGAGRQRCAL